MMRYALLWLASALFASTLAGCSGKPRLSADEALQRAAVAEESGELRQAATLLARPAQAGDARAQYHLGSLYRRGGGDLQADSGLARDWLRRAAEQRHVEAQYDLADLFVFGNREAARRDYAEAARWYRMAAEQGNSDAAHALASLYRNGLGVERSDLNAARWLTRAAEAGQHSAQAALAYLFDVGQGVPQDHAQALHWYRRAAEGGHAFARMRLGDFYRKGHLLDLDLVEAHIWYNLAASQGSDLAARRRDEVGVQLGPERLAAAQREARRRLGF